MITNKDSQYNYIPSMSLSDKIPFTMLVRSKSINYDSMYYIE